MQNLVHTILYVMLIIENIFWVSQMRNRREVHMFYLAKKVGKIWICSCWEKGNFIMINELEYGQTWKIWPSLLNLSLYSTFKESGGWLHLEWLLVFTESIQISKLCIFWETFCNGLEFGSLWEKSILFSVSEPVRLVTREKS